VGHRALTNLKTAAFVSCHLVCTSRPLDSPASVLTPLFLASLHGLKEAEDAYTHPPITIPTLDKIDRIRGHIKDIDAQLLKTLGMEKAPLAYVVRENDVVAAHNTDPSNGYATVQEEMVARMPHTHPSYREDNIAVWDILRDSIHNTEAFSWIKRCEKRRDGRAAYIALTSHYLGDAKNEALRNAADTKILNTFYGGEKNRFNWTHYVSLGTANSVPIITAAIAYDDVITAKTYILIIHQALYFRDKLENNLLNPFQCRLNGVGINECPRILDPSINDDSHSILFPNEDLKIPLQLNGIVSYFPVKATHEGRIRLVPSY
jgi:hypothetical protein